MQWFANVSVVLVLWALYICVPATLVNPAANTWLYGSNFTCQGLSLMLLRKEGILKTLGQLVEQIRSQQAITPPEKLKMEVLQLYARELKATEKSLVAVLRDLNQTLSSDYGSLEKLKRSCRMRMDDMRNAAVSVEEDYNTLLELERVMSSLHPNINLTHNYIINEIMTEISHAADNLESELRKNVFSDSKKMEGAAFETVVKLRDGAFSERGSRNRLQESKEEERWASELPGQGIAMLIDSSNNQYILSRPRDITVPIEDHHLVHDIVKLLVLCFVFGVLCSFFRVPSLFGYIFAGIVIGPVGYNAISSVVQVETIGEFGVIFIVFSVGLEFSPEKLRRVWYTAVYGGNLLLLAGIVLAVLLGLSLGVHPRHSLFVAACLALSSSPLALRIIDGTGSSRHSKSLSDVDHHRPVTPYDEPESDMSSSLVGILVMQDVQLGILMALMPFLPERPAPPPGGSSLSLGGVLQFLQVAVGICLLFLVTKGVSTRFLETFYRLLNSLVNKTENVLLGSVAVCFLFLLVAELLGASLELGCFLAGLALNSQGHSLVEQVRRVVEPVRDFFAVFFFASLGFHVFPTFLKSEFSTILVVTLCVFSLKFLLSVGVLGVFLGPCRWATWIIAFGLTPVSEFAFVLASRGRRLGIISREVYLVILSITALSLLLAPLLWRLTLLSVSLRRSTPYWSPGKLSRTAAALFRGNSFWDSGEQHS